VVALLIKLKLRLLRNGLRNNTAQVVMLVLGVVFALYLAAGGVALLVSLRWAPVDTATNVLVVGGAVLTLAWAIVFRCLAFGVDENPRPQQVRPVARDQPAAGTRPARWSAWSGCPGWPPP